MENVDQVKVDFAAKTATVKMKKGVLTQKTVEAAFKGSKYSVASFEAAAVAPPRTYTLNVSGMT